jgi:hypothetical protein
MFIQIQNGWYVYRKDGIDYVILARLKNERGDWCGFDSYEIVNFTYGDQLYKGVILDMGGAKRDLPTLDIFRTEGCNDCPGLVKTKAEPTGTTLSITTNYDSKYNTILRYN